MFAEKLFVSSQHSEPDTTLPLVTAWMKIQRDLWEFPLPARLCTKLLSLQWEAVLPNVPGGQEEPCQVAKAGRGCRRDTGSGSGECGYPALHAAVLTHRRLRWHLIEGPYCPSTK